MLDPFFKYLETLATDFTWKRLSILMFLIFIVIVGLYWYEIKTANTELIKYDKVINLLKEINNIKTENNYTNKIKENIYIGLLEVTQNQKNINLLDFYIPEKYKLSLFYIFPWLIILIGFLGNKGDFNAFFGAILIIIFLLTVSYSIPEHLNKYIKYGIGILLNLIIVIILINKGKHTNVK